jgi:hypothetical protein
MIEAGDRMTTDTQTRWYHLAFYALLLAVILGYVAYLRPALERRRKSPVPVTATAPSPTACTTEEFLPLPRFSGVWKMRSVGEREGRVINEFEVRILQRGSNIEGEIESVGLNGHRERSATFSGKVWSDTVAELRWSEGDGREIDWIYPGGTAVLHLTDEGTHIVWSMDVEGIHDIWFPYLTELTRQGSWSGPKPESED